MTLNVSMVVVLRNILHKVAAFVINGVTFTEGRLTHVSNENIATESIAFLAIVRGLRFPGHQISWMTE